MLKLYIFKTRTASSIFFSRASFPYLSTSDRLFSPWVRQPAPPMQPPRQAMPSMKLPSRTPFAPSAGRPCIPRSRRRPRACIQTPRSPALLRLGRRIRKGRRSWRRSFEIRGVVQHAFGKEGRSTPLPSNSACSSSKVRTLSTYSAASGRANSAFFAVQGPMKTVFAPGVVSLMYLPMATMGRVVGNVLPHGRSQLPDVIGKSRAARAGQKALFHQLLDSSQATISAPRAASTTW